MRGRVHKDGKEEGGRGTVGKGLVGSEVKEDGCEESVLFFFCPPCISLCVCADSDSQECTLDEKEVIRHLFILGEVAQVGFHNIELHP